jgi:hypothetical protein
LNWHFRSAPLPPLVVGGNPSLPNPGLPGGGNVFPLNTSARDLGQFNGARLTVGSWFDPDGELGGEVSGFVFARQGTLDTFTGGPGQTVSVPVVGTNGSTGVYDFSFPGRFVGSVTLRTADQLWGAESNLLHRWYDNGKISFDSLFGFRYLQFNERVDLAGQSQSLGSTATFLGATLPAGSNVLTIDSFRANTSFYGGQLGAKVEARQGLFTVNVYGKGGVGANVETLRVDGNTVVSGRGIAIGGVRALPTNMGHFNNTDFSLFGETGIQLGVQATKHLSLRVGYNLLYWTDVLRPGNVISPTLTRSQVPIDPTFNARAPATQPVIAFRSSDFLAHGLVVGVVVDW